MIKTKRTTKQLAAVVSNLDQTINDLAPQPTTKMKSDLSYAAWILKTATEKTTPFVQADFDLLAETLEKALRAVKDCGEKA